MTTLPVILVVEDDPIQSEMMFDILTRPRKPVATVPARFTSGRLLFQWLDAQTSLPHIDMILLDMRLPGESGYDLLPRIRQHPQLTDVRVMAVTANVLPVDVERARQAGFDGFVGKPIDPTTLPHYVEYAMLGGNVWKPL